MTLTTFQTSHLGNGQFFNSVFLGQFIMNLSIIFIILDLDVGFSVTIDTPSHGQGGVLIHDLHFLNRPMASLTFYTPHLDVLGVIEIYKVRQVVNSYPFHRFGIARVGLIIFIPTNSIV